MTLGANSDRVRIDIEARDRYSIMWLAGIRQLDLTQHCLKTFADCDRPHVSSKLWYQTVHLPAANPPAAWYLCALPIPWNWTRNAHLAFEYTPGENWKGNALVDGLGVRLHNATPITGWGEHSIPQDAPNRNSRLYRTCRNWQFAWWLRAHYNVRDTQPLDLDARRHPTSEQLTLD
ncbi:hypothetical protein [Streptomyces aureocirculatus]|uniref:hypothetical protein n=1 Tax=Streptomyces aureocirculatus TaxID=67275 RepID=UPI0012FED340|nr:hypothetical protein [Streptomyces aureocirculatus]